MIEDWRFLMKMPILEEYLAKNLIKSQEHPTLPLTIYNYTAQCQYEKQWDHVTLMCRGLVLDDSLTIIAKPFPKFFNYQEVKNIRPGPVRVSEKLDGSLGILFKYNNELVFASKGSFTSQQAIEFRKIWEEKGYNNLLDFVQEGYTYMFEIIYPSNRTVVDYGSERNIILLGITNASGREIEFEHNLLAYYVDKISYIDLPSFQDVLELPQESNKEGFVVKWKDSYRVKVKFEEYKKLHALITNSSPYHVWETLRNDLPLDIFLEKVPDEFYNTVKDYIQHLHNKFNDIKKEVEDYYVSLGPFTSRKDFASLVQTKIPKKYMNIMFLILDNKDYSKVIWDLIKPKNAKSFFKLKS